MQVRILESGGISVVEKRLTTRERGEPEAVASLRDEAALLAKLGGVVTPRLVASGEDWLQTERVPFPTLHDRLEKGEPMPPAWVELAAQNAFRTLAALHEAEDEVGLLDVVHGDLSPANLAVSDDATRCVILDLGLARFRGQSRRADGAFRGSALYVAPEVARGETPTERSDLFALAASLLHAALRAPPRSAPSLAAAIAIAGDQPVLDPRRASLAAVGPAHAAMIACLAHDPAARPASAREVLSRLHRLR